MQTILGKLLFIMMLSSSLLPGYHFTMKIDNPTPMLGEKAILTLHFSYINVEEYEIEEPYFEHFSIKRIEDKEYQDNNGTWHALLRYELSAQEIGTFTLHPLTTHIEMIEKKYQTLYNKNKYLQKFDLQTKALTMKITPLPDFLKIIGHYKLSSLVDKTVTYAGEPIVFKVRLTGEGNIENLDFLTLNIPNVMVYEKNLQPYQKNFTFISDNNFTIPSVSLKYFDQVTKEITTLSTNAFFIKIVGAHRNLPKYHYFWIYLLSGLFFILLLLYVYNLFESLAFIDEKTYLKRQLKQSKNKEVLLKRVVPYLHQNRQLTRLIYQLEDIEPSKFRKVKKKILKHF